MGYSGLLTFLFVLQISIFIGPHPELSKRLVSLVKTLALRLKKLKYAEELCVKEGDRQVH